MYKILIVDDEQHVVDMMATLIEFSSQYDFEIFRSYHGKQVIEILNTNKIDIILLDVQMPGISGIEVYGEVLQRWPDCRVIFLTGYPNFEHLYAINQMKNASFLLKIEDEETILSAIENAVKDIENEKQMIFEKTEQDWQQRLFLHVMRKEAVLSVIGKSSEVNALAEQQKSMQNKYFTFDSEREVYLMSGKINWKEHHTGVCLAEQLTMLTAHYEKCTQNNFYISIIDFAGDSILVVMQTVPEYDLDIPPEKYISESFDSMVDFPVLQFAFTIALIYVPSTISWLKIQKYIHILGKYNFSGVNQLVLENNGKIINPALFNDKQVESFLKLPLQESLLSQLSQQLLRCDEREILRILAELKSHFIPQYSINNLSAIKIFQKITHVYIDCIEYFGLNEILSFKTGVYKLYFYNDYRNWGEAFEYLEQLANIIISAVSSDKIDISQEIVQKAKDYIEESIFEYINVTDIANNINYNSSYLSRIFRAATGERLVEYLTRKKMDKASELIISTSESLASISEKMGYDTAQYFSFVFKKQKGLSPSEYRRRYSSFS